MNPVPKPVSPRKPKSQTPKRKAAPRKRNPARRKSEFARCYHSKERVEFVKSLPCVARTFLCEGDARDNHHIESEGMGRKAGFEKIVPMCRFHHGMLHKCGRADFEQLYSVNLAFHASLTQAAWLRVSGTPEKEQAE